MISQANISPNTPMGANLFNGGGATFRAWAPLATAVYVNGTFGGTPRTGQTDDLRLAKDANGYWTGFVDAAREARSRSRFATGFLLTAPGIPQLFMGQEFLEDKQWSWDPNAPNLIWWAGLNAGTDPAMVNHLRFTQDLIHLRWNYPALRGENVNPFHVHDQNRVIAFHRWLKGTGQDVIIVATLAEDTWYDYGIGFPFAGPWREVFNSDVYDNWVNPIVAGNQGGISASGPPLHGFQASANIVIPANGFVVFARTY